MLRTIGIAALLTLTPGFVGPAFAYQRPQDMAAIDKAMQTAQLSASDKRKVMDLRKQGEELQKAGNRPQSEKVLDQAKKMLKI
ncbi:hypothetical protein AA309_31130 [Microvirga vignae]|uniref:Uncharacterized protein n=1 Tax=Microvirga vignae TaxID=1225564 RepID=A0A0H1R2R1_9HYPH|nr:hypothetical protein [Microvirga vignae]KLK89490.1 hypothetical protein AA309_31130 [Microvirga vignae]